MDEPLIPSRLIEARHTTVWAELRVAVGAVRDSDVEGDDPRRACTRPTEA